MRDESEQNIFKRWWYTDCERCRRWRAIIFWGVLMMIVVQVVWF